MTSTVENNLKEKPSQKLIRLRAFIEEMELQFTLGKAELIDEFEIQKKSLKSFISQQKENINLTEKTNGLKRLFEELELQLALGKAETADMLEEQRKNIGEKINSIEELITTYEENQEAFFEMLTFKFYKLRTTMEMARLEFALGKADLKDEIKKEKQDIIDKFSAFKLEISNDVDIVEEGFNLMKAKLKSLFNGFITGLKFK